MVSEKIQWAAFPGFPGLRTLWADNVVSLWRVYHDTYTVCCAMPGSRPYEGDVFYRRKSYAGEPGDTLSFQPGELHTTRKLSSPVNFQVVQMEPSLIEKAAQELGISGMPALVACQSKRADFFQAFARLHQAFKKQSTLLARQTALARCVEALLANCEKKPLLAPPGFARPGLNRAKDLIHARCAENISLDELAQEAGLSRFHFLRAFSKEFGLPPHAYQNHLRIAQACSWIASGKPPGELELGFSDQSHFIRHFKRVAHCLPSKYLLTPQQ